MGRYHSYIRDFITLFTLLYFTTFVDLEIQTPLKILYNSAHFLGIRENRGKGSERN